MKVPLSTKFYTMSSVENKNQNPLRSNFYSQTQQPQKQVSKINYSQNNQNIFKVEIPQPKFQSNLVNSFIPKSQTCGNNTPFMTIKSLDIQMQPFMNQQKVRPQSAKPSRKSKEVNDELTITQLQTPRKVVYKSQIQTQNRFQRVKSAQSFTPQYNGSSKCQQDARVQVFQNQTSSRLSIDDFEII
ncbi:hypothetical protein SS50377_24302 [Spironucleus salmonicida]|uniref:Uncharacterized protein n=1 Tax=Spironucleus salmonicida TaxID=348837 RepID=V6LKG7_9EUKA|nr:hypothetical protein SS50377_24302 [Spironucleus salmonicida]|eukprot:EST44843.1 Hypothetical protein SS50377_15289 [Spironucleus salmonicida]